MLQLKHTMPWPTVALQRRRGRPPPAAARVAVSPPPPQRGELALCIPLRTVLRPRSPLQCRLRPLRRCRVIGVPAPAALVAHDEPWELRGSSPEVVVVPGQRPRPGQGFYAHAAREACGEQRKQRRCRWPAALGCRCRPQGGAACLRVAAGGRAGFRELDGSAGWLRGRDHPTKFHAPGPHSSTVGRGS